MAQSHARIVGQALPEGPGADLVERLWNAPVAIVAHGTETDPLFFFGNARALEAFEASVGKFVGMPSRYSAEMPNREERQNLLDRVSRNGFIDDYSGMRISANGRRFMIEGAVVWNLVDADGVRQGQAAAFAT